MDAACAAGAGGEVTFRDQEAVLAMLEPRGDPIALMPAGVSCPFCGGAPFMIIGGLAQHVVTHLGPSPFNAAMRALSPTGTIVRCACGQDFCWGNHYLEPESFGAHLLDVIRAGAFAEHFKRKPL